ncbi:hypothetical protein TNCV_1893881 [Trichonephila clavipes]|nr:hypothetical protein TNCV_1893881 [Trichonephila clavipes]
MNQESRKNRQAARNRGGKNRKNAIQQLRWESELNELRLEVESIRSNVKRTSCAEDRKKTSSNYRISIGRVVYVKVKGEQEMVNAVIDTGAQMPVVRLDVVEGQSIDNRGSIQITSALGKNG